MPEGLLSCFHPRTRSGVTTASAHGLLSSRRGSLLFHSASFVPVDRRTYAASVNPVSGSPATWKPARWSEPSSLGSQALTHPQSKGFSASRALRATLSLAEQPLPHQMKLGVKSLDSEISQSFFQFQLYR